MSVSRPQLLRPNPSRQNLAGVNLAGYLRTESGVGAAARGYLRALRTLGVPTALADLSGLQNNRSEDPTLTSFDRSYPFGTNLICADVELHYAIMDHVGDGFFQGHDNVGIWAWELTDFPEKWHDRFAFYDEIWVGTSFIANALAPVSPIPVLRVPPVLTVEHPGSREEGRRRLGVQHDELVFLFMFDFHSHAERKNPLGVVDAFRMAFRPDDSARLVVKCVNADPRSPEFAVLRDRARGARIELLCGYWPSQHVQDLMAACDVYVSLHRSEGTGLTITDAMALGKAVIATGWSGNMDIMTVANSFPVEYDLVEITRSVGPYTAGSVWAEPSTRHAAQLMRGIYDDQAEADRRGRRAQRDLARDFGEHAIARLIDRRLAAIDARRHLDRVRASAWLAYRGYRGLPARLQAIARDVVPRDATVLVASKGDASLLDLGGPEGWHFPRSHDGAYAGYYPADSAEAIDHLEQLRAHGATHLLFPCTALWWLESYRDFGRHLDSRYRQVLQSEDCVIYALVNRATEPGTDEPRRKEAAA